MAALGTRVLWALAWGLESDPEDLRKVLPVGKKGKKVKREKDGAVAEDDELKKLGNNLSFRQFMKWVRKVVQLQPVHHQELIAGAVQHHIGGQFIEDDERAIRAIQRKRDVAAFLGLSFVDTIVRLTCRGPIDNLLPEMTTDGSLEYIYNQYSFTYKHSNGIKVIGNEHFIKLMDDLVVASLYRTVVGGKYKVTSIKYDDPVDAGTAKAMMELIGGVNMLKEEEEEREEEDDTTHQTNQTNQMVLHFSQLEKWIIENQYKSIYERHQLASESRVGYYLMTLLERLTIASACQWSPPGVVAGWMDYVPPMSKQEKQNLKQMELNSRDKHCSTEIGFWRLDPRLDNYNIEEIPIPEITYTPNRGSGIRMDVNMNITAVRVNSNAELLGLQPGDMIVSILGEGEGSSSSDYLFSKKRNPGSMIQLISTEGIQPNNNNNNNNNNIIQ